MNDIQLYNYYLTIPLSTINKHSWIYPKYVLDISKICKDNRIQYL